MSADDYNGDGYPTDAALESILTFTGTPKEFVERIAELSNNGFVTAEDFVDHWDSPRKKVTVVTGGWSGVEEVISYMQQTLFWMIFWESSNRGGTHVFEMSETMWDSNALDWGKP